MRSSVLILGSAAAGFAGATFAMLVFGSLGVSASPKTLTANTLRVSHIIVDGDIKVNSSALSVLEFTNPGGGHLRIANGPGIPGPDGNIKPKTGFFNISMGSDSDNPAVLITDTGVTIASFVNNDYTMASLSASYGIKSSFAHNGVEQFSSTLKPEALNIRFEGTGSKATNLTPNGLACFDSANTVIKCP